MNNSKKKVFEKAGDIFLNIAEASVNSVRRQALSNSKNKRFSEEYRQRWADIADNYSDIKNRIHDFTERNKDDELCEDYLTDYEFSDYTNKSDSCCTKEEHVVKKRYMNPAKADAQVVSAHMSNMSSEEKSIIREDSWQHLGKLKNINCENQKIDGVGIIRLIVADEIVYICRAIALNNGGIMRKILDLKNLKISKKVRIYSEISKNIDSIFVDILHIGNDMQAVEMCRFTEKALMQEYSPKWMER